MQVTLTLTPRAKLRQISSASVELTADIDAPFTDEELEALALEGDIDAPLGDDARNVWEVMGVPDQTLLPSWYMPNAVAGPRQAKGWRRRVTFAVIGAFLLIDAYGLCSTYGQVVLAGVPALGRSPHP